MLNEMKGGCPMPTTGTRQGKTIVVLATFTLAATTLAVGCRHKVNLGNRDTQAPFSDQGQDGASWNDGTNLDVRKVDKDGALSADLSKASSSWVISLGENSVGCNNSISVDGAGNSFVTGSYISRAVLGSTTLSTWRGSDGIFVTKVDNTGNIQWAKGGYAFMGSWTTDIAQDGAGNSYIAAYFGGWGMFDGVMLESPTVFWATVIKLNPSGSIIWHSDPIFHFSFYMAYQGPGLSDFRFETDNGGITYISGSFRDLALFGKTMLSASSYDVYVGKIDTTGRFSWIVSSGEPNNDWAYGITTDKVGNSYVTGGFGPSINLSSLTLTAKGSRDTFVAKVNQAGKFAWATTISSVQFSSGNSIAIDKTGNLYVAGIERLESSKVRGIVTKIDGTGNIKWSTKIYYLDTGAYGDPFPIAVDNSGHVHLAGSYTDIAILGKFTLTSKGGPDGFLAKLDSSGNVVEALSTGGRLEDRITGIAIDGAGNRYVTGCFKEVATFGTTTLVSSGTSGRASNYIWKVDDR
jgi:hypothetical protein